MGVKQMEGSHKPDLLFIDINKPESRSYDFLTSFSELDEKLKSGIVVIVLSGDPEEKVQSMMVKEVKEFISKPLELNILYNLVEKYF